MGEGTSTLKVILTVVIGLFIAIVALRVIAVLFRVALGMFFIFVNIAVVVVICYLVWWFIKSVINAAK